ncbi:MAG: UDP-N-acetylmuramoyl-L-alanyl-D-glutamate--2,6-diaminopimelate ligase [Candidatus Krumholzibacteriales bacterium]
MFLSLLIEEIELLERFNYRDVEIRGISDDSRSVSEGELFVAVRGIQSDGHNYIKEALSRGAAAVVAEEKSEIGVPLLVVKDSREAAALLAAKLMDFPSRDMTMAGITGTNGKTSTAFMLKSILEGSMGKTGILGTVGFGIGDSIAYSGRTTPAALELNRKLSSFRSEGCKAVVMEVSSHSVDQKRIFGTQFDIGVFTNISRDHLNYHHSFENYLEAKKGFVNSLTNGPGKKGSLVYNFDDRLVREVGEEFRGRKVSFGLSEEADFAAAEVRADLQGTSMKLVTPEWIMDIRLNLLGLFSIYNGLAAASAAYLLGIAPDDIKRGLERVKNVPGRFQVVSEADEPVVVVDYAHTPDALENILSFCRELKPGKLITVFGCGGDRDRGKRPMMGEIAARLSDSVYVTSDNPRTEDPGRIIDEIMEGIDGQNRAVRVIPDRREAIRAGIEEARRGDLVMVAGKGHEEVLVVGTRRVRFSDLEEARKALRLKRGDPAC